MINIIGIKDQTFISKIEDRKNEIKKDVYFFDWIPPSKTKERDIQTKKLSELQLDTPIILFDRYCSITNKEFKKLNERNSVLLEPAINHRNNFVFCPYWFDIKEPNLDTFKNDRTFSTGYLNQVYNDGIFHILLDTYMKSDINIGIQLKNGKSWKEFTSDRYKRIKLLTEYNYKDFKTLLIYDRYTNIQKGVLPDISMINDGVLPLLFHKHKWCHCLFKDYIISNESDLRWYYNMYDKISYGFIKDIQSNINEYLPGMIVDNFISNIINIYKRM